MTIAQRFATLPLTSDEKMMLQDAYDSVESVPNGWEFLRTYNPPHGFMFSSHPTLTSIQMAMKYDGHSGLTYGRTMRSIEYIAKYGWEAYERLLMKQT